MTDAPLKDRLIATAWWCLAEADHAAMASSELSRTLTERKYFQRREARLRKQAEDLFFKAGAAASVQEAA